MSTIDANGLVIDRYDEVKEALDADLKTTFGEGIKLDADSVFGQISAIISERISDQNELIELVAEIFNPNAAQGVFQSQLVKLNGIDRNESVFSTVSVNVTANTAGATIPAGSTVSDPAVGEKFAIDTTTVLAPSATSAVSATAVNAGNIEAPSGTLTKIDTPIYGWASVTNPSDASPGASEESDQELRIRRDIAASAGGTSNAGAILTAVKEVDGVDLAQVYENKSSVTDSRGIPPHSIWAVVRGGTDADIAETLFNKTAAGAGWYGTTTVAYADPSTGQSYDVKFSRPTEKTIYVTYLLQKLANYPANGDDLIIANTVAFFNGEFYLNETLIDPFGLDDDVVASRLYSPANAVPGHKILEVYIGLTASPTDTDDIPIAADELAGTETAKVVVS
jgi:uncharacterized phage protein gp47/JayE